MPRRTTGELAALRAKAQLYDELVEQLATTERQLTQVRRSHCRDGVDPAWREIANDLASALRPYSLFGEMVVRDGRIVVQTSVPGATLTAARDALDRLAAQVARESYRQDGMVPEWSDLPASAEDHGQRAA